MADIKVNMGALEEIASDCYKYMRSLEEMHAALSDICVILEEQSGEAIRALLSRKATLEKHIAQFKAILNDIYRITKDYVNEMQGYLAPIDKDKMMRVDRDDIWFNLTQLKASADIGAVNDTYMLPTRFGNYGIVDQALVDANWQITEQIQADVYSLQAWLKDELYQMEMEFNQQVVPFDECDAYFGARAGELYNKYSTQEEKQHDNRTAVIDGFGAFWNGASDAGYNLLAGTTSALGNMINYAAAWLIQDFSDLTGLQPPDWVADAINGGNTVIYTLWRDPSLIFEGMGQGAVDTVQDKDKGIPYILGAAGFEILSAKAISLKFDEVVTPTLNRLKTARAVGIGDNAFNHLVYVEGISRSGVSGGHNMEEFLNALRQAGYNVDDCILLTKPHPTIEGVYEIYYQLPPLDITGNPINPIEFNQLRPIRDPKTVYNPAIISDAQMYQWGQEALKNAVINGNKVEGTASNGLKFFGWVDENGVIKNFYPIVKSD